MRPSASRAQHARAFVGPVPVALHHLRARRCTARRLRRSAARACRFRRPRPSCRCRETAGRSCPACARASCGVECVTGDVSDRPYPSFSGRPMRRSNSSITSTGHGAPPLLKLRTCSSPYSRDLRMVEQRDEHGRHGREIGRPEVANRRPAPAPGSYFGMNDLQRADADAHHHADRERVDVEVRNDDQVALARRETYAGFIQSRSARRSRRCCRGSASRPSACRSSRRCIGGPPDRPDGDRAPATR